MNKYITTMGRNNRDLPRGDACESINNLTNHLLN